MADQRIARPVQWAISIVSAGISGLLGLFLTKVIDRLGVLDGPAIWLADWLAANIDGADLSVVAGFSLSLFAYMAVLRLVWRRGKTLPPASAEPIASKAPASLEDAESTLRTRALALADILRGRIELANDALEPLDETKLAKWEGKSARQRLFAIDRLERIDAGGLGHNLAHKLELSIALAKELNNIARDVAKGKAKGSPAQRVGAYRHCAVKLYRQLAEIAGIDTDWRASKARLAPASRDVSLPEALAYAATGRWGERFIDTCTKGEDWQGGDVWQEARQKARDNAITIWGKPSPNSTYEPIPATFWTMHQPEWFSLLRGEAHTEAATADGANGRYIDLMASRAEFEREWPHDRAE